MEINLFRYFTDCVTFLFVPVKHAFRDLVWNFLQDLKLPFYLVPGFTHFAGNRFEICPICLQVLFQLLNICSWPTSDYYFPNGFSFDFFNFFYFFMQLVDNMSDGFVWMFSIQWCAALIRAKDAEDMTDSTEIHLRSWICRTHADLLSRIMAIFSQFDT